MARVLVEGVVIVGSILLALALDAAWTERQERLEEREELARVYAELESVGQARNAGHSWAASAAAELVRILEDVPPGSLRVEVPDTVLYQLMSTPTYEAPTPALDGLRQSGRISIVEDPEVRLWIAAWERAVTNASEWELRARAFVDAQIIPALSQRGDVGHVFRVGRGSMTRSALDLAGATHLRADDELKALVSQRYYNAARASEGQDRLNATGDSLMTAIKKSLGR